MNEFICFLDKYKPIIEFMTALLPIVLAVLGSYIAIQQYKTNKKRLKKDLFEKRYAVFESTNNFVSLIVRKTKVDQAERNEFITGTRGAEFLFDNKIKLYITEIWERSVDLGCWAEDEQTSTHASERAEHLKWFNKQLSEIDNVFKPYIKLEH